MDPVTIALLAGGFLLTVGLFSGKSATDEEEDEDHEEDEEEEDDTQEGDDTTSSFSATSSAIGSGGPCTSAMLLNALYDPDEEKLFPQFQNLAYHNNKGKTQPTEYQCDCSDLLGKGARKAGCTLPRAANAQFKAGTEIDAETARNLPGALVALQGNKGIFHIELGVGDGKKVLACWQGSGTRKAPQSWGWWSRGKKPSAARFARLGGHWDPAADIYFGLDGKNNPFGRY